MKKILLAGLLGLTISSTAIAEQKGLNLQLSDETFRIAGSSETEWMQEVYRLEAGIQYHNEQHHIADLSILYTSKGLVDPNVDFGFKAKFSYVDQVDTTYGVMLGAFGRYWLPTPIPVSAVGEFMISPKVMTFGEGESMQEWIGRVHIQMLRNLNLFIGYRLYEMDYGSGRNVEFENEPHIGFDLRF
jgi:hypothetical protein